MKKPAIKSKSREGGEGEGAGAPARGGQGPRPGERFTLVHEFVPLKEHEEELRQATLCALLGRTQFREGGAIVVCTFPAGMHKARLAAQSVGFTCGEIGKETGWRDRIMTVEDFEQRRIKVLFCTEGGLRSLNFSGVLGIINYHSPSSLKSYQTRAGYLSARHCPAVVHDAAPFVTIISEKGPECDMQVMQAVIHAAKVEKTWGELRGEEESIPTGLATKLRNRRINEATLTQWAEAIESRKGHVALVIADDAAKKEMAKAMGELDRGLRESRRKEAQEKLREHKEALKEEYDMEEDEEDLDDIDLDRRVKSMRVRTKNNTPGVKIDRAEAIKDERRQRLKESKVHQPVKGLSKVEKKKKQILARRNNIREKREKGKLKVKKARKREPKERSKNKGAPKRYNRR